MEVSIERSCSSMYSSRPWHWIIMNNGTLVAYGSCHTNQEAKQASQKALERFIK